MLGIESGSRGSSKILFFRERLFSIIIIILSVPSILACDVVRILAGVIPRSCTSVRYMEPQVDPHHQIEDDHDPFDQKVEDKKASFRVEPCRPVARSGCCVVDAHSKSRPQSQQRRCDDEDIDLAAKSTGAEFLQRLGAGNDEGRDNEKDWHKTDDGVEGSAV